MCNNIITKEKCKSFYLDCDNFLDISEMEYWYSELNWMDFAGILEDES